MDPGGLIDGFGLPGVFLVGIVDGEGAAFVGGILAHRGFFRFEVAALTVAAAGLVFDNAAYLAGRMAGRNPAIARLLSREAAVRFRARVDRRPVAAVVLARFVYGLHGVATLVLGAHRVPWRLFAPANLCAVAVWAHLWTGLGYVAGQAMERFFGALPLHHHLALALAGVALLLVAWVLLARRGL